MIKTLTFIFLLQSGSALAQTRLQLTCHRPLESKNGADVLTEVNYETTGAKKIFKTGPIFIKVWDNKRSETINSNIMSGQSAQSGQFLMYVEDLRVHSLILNLEPGSESIVKTVKNDVVLEYKTNCSTVPKIPNKK
jgi:hypothetical protein